MNYENVNFFITKNDFYSSKFRIKRLLRFYRLFDYKKNVLSLHDKRGYLIISLNNKTLTDIEEEEASFLAGYIWENQFDEDKDCVELIFSHPKDIITYSTKNRVILSQFRYYILKRQNWKCNICLCKLKYSRTHKYGDVVAHIDHIHPFSKRETYFRGAKNIHELENLQGLCQKCNLKKSNKIIY